MMIGSDIDALLQSAALISVPVAAYTTGPPLPPVTEAPNPSIAAEVDPELPLELPLDVLLVVLLLELLFDVELPLEEEPVSVWSSAEHDNSASVTMIKDIKHVDFIMSDAP